MYLQQSLKRGWVGAVRAVSREFVGKDEEMVLHKPKKSDLMGLPRIVG